MKVLHMIAFLLVVIGGLNWLLVGLTGWDVGQLFGGQGAIISKVIYVLVGLATVWLIIEHKKTCTMCGGNKASVSAPMSGSSM